MGAWPELVDGLDSKSRRLRACGFEVPTAAHCTWPQQALARPRRVPPRPPQSAVIGHLHPFLLELGGGQGVWVKDSRGNRYLRFCVGRHSPPALLAHSDWVMRRGLSRQLGRLTACLQPVQIPETGTARHPLITSAAAPIASFSANSGRPRPTKRRSSWPASHGPSRARH